MKRLVILGAGTAGTMVANKLRRRLPMNEWQLTVVDRDDLHLYQPGLLFIPFGTYKPDEVTKPRSSFLADGIRLELGEIDRIDPVRQTVALDDHRVLGYD